MKLRPPVRWMMRRLAFLLLPLPAAACACLACACLIGCEKTALSGGSDTETLTGAVSSPDGSPAVSALVKLIPADYDPSLSDTSLILRTLTDAKGSFRFKGLKEGASYNLIAGNAPARTWAYAGGIQPGAGDPVLALGPAKVFFFSLHSDNYLDRDSGIAYFPGTDILTRCDGASASEVDSVPEGALRFVVESRAGWKHDTTLIAVPDTANVSAGRDGIVLDP